jgi:XTP/dITP diphosphohydrolase
MVDKILLATMNPNKVREIRSLLRDLPVEVLAPGEAGISLQVLEEGKTYAENAGKKALAFACASGLISLGDDTGLEVDALGGAPGLYSARYFPQAGATDADRRAYLLKNLRGMPRPWTARFRCCAAVAAPDGTVIVTEGICKGEIIPEERGRHGFGYDPIFLITSIDKTMAELTLEEKNKLSHRAYAVRAAIPHLLSLL